ncbi:MAG: RsmE family RNA methyltransferase [Vicinamibacterales bacterium]
MVAPRFFAPGLDATADRVVLPADEAHHLRHVLRLAPGADAGVFDGAGHEWRGRVGQVGRREVTIEALVPVPAVAEPAVRVTLYAGLLKGEPMDHVVRDAVALGVAAIVPLHASRVAVPARARLTPALAARWHRVAVAAAKQCGRAVVPAIGGLATLADALDTHDVGGAGGAGDARSSGHPGDHAVGVIMAVEPGARPDRAGPGRAATWPEADWSAAPAAVRLLVGPEGGWTPEEVAGAESRGARLLPLGPRVLRAELAPAVALSVLWSRWGW